MTDQKTTITRPPETAKRTTAERRGARLRVEEVYRLSRKKMVNMLRRQLRVPDDSEDALHDAVEKLLVRGVPERVRRLEGYLVGMARNEAYQQYRRVRVESADPSELEERSKWHAQQRSVEENFMSNDILGKVLELLTPEERKAVELVKVKGLTYAQAAEEMKVSQRRIEAMLATAKALALDFTSGEGK